MKRLRRRIVASDSPLAHECILSPNDLVDLLKMIPELQGCNISIEDSPTGSIVILVGDMAFEVSDVSQPIV